MLITKHIVFVGFSLQDPNFGEVAGTVRRALQRSADEDAPPAFGTLLTLHNRPFLAELWADLECVPMDPESEQPLARPNADCARDLEIFLDKVSLDASTCTKHLLDPNFDGVFDPSEQAVKAHLDDFRERLRKNERARRAAGFEIVAETLTRLGDPSQQPDSVREAPPS